MEGKRRKEGNMYELYDKCDHRGSSFWGCNTNHAFIYVFESPERGREYGTIHTSFDENADETVSYQL